MAYQAASDFKISDRTLSPYPIEEEMLALHVEVERLITFMNFVRKSSSSTCSLIMIAKNSNSSFNVSHTLCKNS